jgi:Tfp pilus assembly protein PilE
MVQAAQPRGLMAMEILLALIIVIVGVTIFCIRFQYKYQNKFLAERLPAAKQKLYDQMLIQEKQIKQRREIQNLKKELEILEAEYRKKALPKEFDLGDLENQFAGSIIGRKNKVSDVNVTKL